MCLSAHRRFPLGSHDPEIRARSVALFRDAARLCCDLGVRIIQLAGYDVYYEQGDADTIAWFRENLAKCVEIAAQEGVRTEATAVTPE